MALSTTNYLLDQRQAETVSADQPPAKVRILFVDDEPAMLRVLKLGMRTMNGVWDMDFAQSGEEGLALVEQKVFDVIVTDMRMPGMNGAQLLNHVLRTQPHTIRIILSGYADLGEVVNSVGLTHQFLEKPCTLDDLKECLMRVTAVKSRLLHDESYSLAASLKNLPVLPELYLEISDAIQTPSIAVPRIAELAGQDPELAAQLVQIANSAYFGFSRPADSVTAAVQLLGVNIIQSLALAVPVFTAYSRTQYPSFPIAPLWEHSLQTALLSRRIYSQYLSDVYWGEQAFCAGLLHDLGKLILAAELPEKYAAVQHRAETTRQPVAGVEYQYFQATHADVGGYLLAVWGLPIPLVEAVANHHNPRRCGLDGLSLAGVVHIADALQYPDAETRLDMDYLQLVGLERQYELWRAEHGTVNLPVK